MQRWLRYEWGRTGLPFSKTNDACGVKNAATRKYFTKDHLWYYPPPKAFEKIAEYANKHGSEGRKALFFSKWYNTPYRQRMVKYESQVLL